MVAGKYLQHVGRLSGRVVELDGLHQREGDGDAVLLQHEVSALGYGADDATDAEVLGVGHGGGDKLDLRLLEEAQDGLQRAHFVLQEDRELIDHGLLVDWLFVGELYRGIIKEGPSAYH